MHHEGMTTPTYTAIVKETGIVPEKIYARCSSLVQFNWQAFRRVATSTPRPGAKPINKRKKAHR
jgi:hypothetical protein